MTRADAPWTLAADDFDWTRIAHLRDGHSLSVVVPAQNEAATVGAVIDSITRHDGFVDEILVVNDHSSDDTHAIATRHGARVLELTGTTGKGAALRAGLDASRGELIVFLDADVLNPGVDYVARMVQPLLERPEIQFVKGYYERPLHDMPTGGGRVNELTARPILSLLYPGLGEIRQPLAGETAARRDSLLALNFDTTYGVEIAMLIDVAREHGVAALAQVDLGTRRHRNRPLDELRPMAVEVLRAALTRRDVELPSGD